MNGSDGRVKIGLYLSIENPPWVDDILEDASRVCGFEVMDP